MGTTMVWKSVYYSDFIWDICFYTFCNGGGRWRRKMTQCLLVLVVYTYTECAGCIPSCHFCLLKTRSILSGLLLVDITITIPSHQHHHSAFPHLNTSLIYE